MAKPTRSDKGTFTQMPVAEFFRRNRALAGFSNPARATYQTIKELVENSLDATENYGILPEVEVKVTREGASGGGGDALVVECSDNGIGIPPQHVPRAFGQVLYGSKYVNKQSRGLFGLGVKMAVIYAQVTTGEPVHVETSPAGDTKLYTFDIKIDMKRNSPVVVSKGVSESGGRHGTRVRLKIAGDWGRARKYVLEYITRTAVLTPFATIRFSYSGDGDPETVEFARTTEKMPKPPKVKKPHPYGVDLETLGDMLRSAPRGMRVTKFLESRFDRVGSVTAARVVEMAGLSTRKTVGGMSGEDVKRLWSAMQSFKWPRPSADGLSPLGEELIVDGLSRVYSPEFATAVQRPPGGYGGHAFIVEAGAAWGGGVPVSEDATPILLRFFNKIPAVYDEGDCAITKVVRGIDLGNYGLRPPQPLVVAVHVVSTRLPFKGLGKEALAEIPEIQREVELAVREVLRRVSRHVARKRKEEEEARRRLEIMMYRDMVARGVAGLTGVKPEHVAGAFDGLIRARLG